MNVFGKAEHFLQTRVPLNWVLYYLLTSFALFLVGHLLGIGSVQYSEGSYRKEIGLWWSVNWTITFLILYPFFCYVATSGAANIRQFWADAGDSFLVTGRDGAPKSGNVLQQEWTEWLRRSSKIAYAFALICIAIGTTDFMSTAGRPLYACKIAFPGSSPELSTAPIDWATILTVINQNQCTEYRLFLLLDAGALYVLLVLSLIFFLNYLYYSGFVFGFLSKVAQRSGESRLILRLPELSARLAPVIENLMLCVVLGLAVCALMRAHYEYLQSMAPNAVQFLTGDVSRIAGDLKDLFSGTSPSNTGAPPAPKYYAYQQMYVAKGLTVWPLVATILVVGLVGLGQLYTAIQNALLYFHQKTRADSKWINKINMDPEQAKKLNEMTAMQILIAIASPYLFVYLVVCALLILSIITSSMLIFIASALVVLAYRFVFDRLLAKSKPIPITS